MSRAKKLLIVSFVLALGIGLAWPYRKIAPSYVPDARPEMSNLTGEGTLTQQQPPVVPPAAISAPARQQPVPAKMASTAEDSLPTTPSVGFDLEDHAALAEQSPDQVTPTADSPITTPVPPTPPRQEEPTSRPVYATGDTDDETAWPEEVVHIVRNGDTLEKLAERYLGDAGRAMELFDLNSEQLSNPHLLPIDAEIRIPIPVRREDD